ncbi:MAG: alpha/beta hydrolase [Balneolaceae bacterium]|nr:alpha/beta hydrolase [Balneolaceae bacterium]
MNWNRLFVTTAFVLAISLTGFRSAAQVQQPDSIVVYKTVGDIELELHLFFPQHHSPEGKTPAILFFHGGGWKGGNPTHFYPQSRYLARRGMVAANAEYRIKNKHNTTPREAVEDAKSAIRWLRSHAADFGIDPDKLAAGGGSAGGHIAAAAGMIDDFANPQIDADSESVSTAGTPASFRPDALVLFNPVFDNGPGGYGYERVKPYWRSISPLHNIDEHAPPTILFFGTEDDLVPVSTIKRFKRRMEEHGVRCDLHLYEGYGHAFFNEAKYTETLYEADRFLESLGYLEGPPTLSVE